LGNTLLYGYPSYLGDTKHYCTIFASFKIFVHLCGQKHVHENKRGTKFKGIKVV